MNTKNRQPSLDFDKLTLVARYSLTTVRHGPLGRLSDARRDSDAREDGRERDAIPRCPLSSPLSRPIISPPRLAISTRHDTETERQ